MAAEDKAKKALREARQAIVAVHQGHVEQPGRILFEGIRAYSANGSDGRARTIKLDLTKKPRIR